MYRDIKLTTREIEILVWSLQVSYNERRNVFNPTELEEISVLESRLYDEYRRFK